MNQEKSKLIGHGFQIPIISPDQHIFGVQQTPIVIQDNGDWRDFLPPFEQQSRAYFDTYGCTIYNTLTPIEILDRKLFGEQSEYSERAVYIGTGTRPPGNSPHVVAEWIRKNGLIPESMLPFDDSLTGLTDYISPNPLTVKYIEEGKRWFAQKSFEHDWVFVGGDSKLKTDKLKEALRSSPLGVSVVGWKERNGYYYKDEGDTDNHWTVLIAYENNHPIIFDSYPPFIKKLEASYNFGFAKRYTIKKEILPNLNPTSNAASLGRFIFFLRNTWKFNI